MVLNLVVGTEPHKFHTCIHGTLRVWKNKMCVVKFIFFTFIVQNLLPPNPWTWLTEPRLRTTDLYIVTLLSSLRLIGVVLQLQLKNNSYIVTYWFSNVNNENSDKLTWENLQKKVTLMNPLRLIGVVFPAWVQASAAFHGRQRTRNKWSATHHDLPWGPSGETGRI